MQVRARAGAAFLKLPPRLQRQVLHAGGRYAPWEPQFDQHAPVAPPGLVTAAPGFVGVGVQKAGTSWWYDLIVSHPDAYHHPGFHKERHFFTHRFDDGLDESGITEYRRWFPRPAGRLTGEWTPDYLHQHWTPAMLATAAPEAKVLVLLRDPVERFRSGLDHHHSRGEPITAMIAGDAFARGLYGLQLERLERAVKAQQTLVLLYEECCDDPAAMLRRSYAFLGLDDGFLPPELRSRVSATASPRTLDRRRRDELAERYADDLRRLASLRPELDLGRWPVMAPTARRS